MREGPAPLLTCFMTLGKFLPLSGLQFSFLYSLDTVDLDDFLFPAAHTSWDLENFQLSPCGRWGGRNSSRRELKALEESRPEMLVLLCISDPLPPPIRVLFPESAAWECRGMAAVSRAWAGLRAKNNVAKALEIFLLILEI